MRLGHLSNEADIPVFFVHVSECTKTDKSSAVAEMAAQCCTIRIFTVELLESGAPIFNVLCLGNVGEYHHKSYITEKQ